MSGGSTCRCPERAKPVGLRRWRVLQRHCNHSAFNGRHYTPSDWSAVACGACHASWRTKAAYVHQLQDRSQAELYRGTW